MKFVKSLVIAALPLALITGCGTANQTSSGVEAAAVKAALQSAKKAAAAAAKAARAAEAAAAEAKAAGDKADRVFRKGMRK